MPKRVLQRTPAEVFCPLQALTGVAGELALFAFEKEAIQRFGPRVPLRRIVQDRQQRVEALQRLCQKYRVALPPLPVVKPVLPVSWNEFLRREVDLLVDNLRLYNQLLDSGPGHPDADRVLINLRQETLRGHLPKVLEERWV